MNKRQELFAFSRTIERINIPAVTILLSLISSAKIYLIFIQKTIFCGTDKRQESGENMVALNPLYNFAEDIVSLPFINHAKKIRLNVAILSVSQGRTRILGKFH